MAKFKRNALYQRGFKDGADEGFNIGFEKGVIEVKKHLYREVAEELERTISNVEGIGDVLHRRIIDAVEKKAKEIESRKL